MTRKGQPGRPAAVGDRVVILVQYRPNQVFVAVDRKRFGDLHCYPTGSEVRFALLHLNDGAYEFGWRTLRPWLCSTGRRMEQLIFSFLENVLKCEKCRWSNNDRDARSFMLSKGIEGRFTEQDYRNCFFQATISSSRHTDECGLSTRPQAHVTMERKSFTSVRPTGCPYVLTAAH